MENNKTSIRKRTVKILKSIIPLGGLFVYVIMALASSSASKTINSDEFREGFREGWKIGEALSSDGTNDIERVQQDTIPLEESLVASLD